MNENLNLVEILKDCPMGTRLYSPLYGDVELVGVSRSEVEYPIEIKLSDGMTDTLTKNGKIYELYRGECMLYPSRSQRDWSKFKPIRPKFDPKTLQPFDKVLVRDEEEEQWSCAFYSHIRDKTTYKYATTDYSHIFCIPYNDETKHLVGTTDEAPECYRYWEG